MSKKKLFNMCMHAYFNSSYIYKIYTKQIFELKYKRTDKQLSDIDIQEKAFLYVYVPILHTKMYTQQIIDG